jgi:polyisoprenyl-teichoic acid--peptidoglycan teichoic acid transferase
MNKFIFAIKIFVVLFLVLSLYFFWTLEIGDFNKDIDSSIVESLDNTSSTTQVQVKSQDFDFEKFKEEMQSMDIEQKNQDILIMGKSGDNIDTIMIASLNTEKKLVTLISIPRDLFFEDRKINSYYHYFGIEKFIEKIVKISGREIVNHIMVDMMVFPDIIDELGGVDFEFSEELIDPSYKTIDDGEIGTLHYEKGIEHLGGTEALRVARSRYTSSDFSRAKRQQKLIKALSTKIKTIKIRDVIFTYIPMLIKKVDTDLSLLESSSLFWNVKDYEIRIGSVISSGNVLESEMYELPNGKKMYILEPIDDDWDLIKQYINREIK